MDDDLKIPNPRTARRTSTDRRLQEQERKPERRVSDERRQKPDPRGIHYSFEFVSLDALEELRKWLKANCDGDFTINNPDKETAIKRGEFRVKFERESDAAKLRKMLGVHWPSWMG